MSARRKTKLPNVSLLNIPCYLQGAFDGLCCYYTGAMMLVSLFPEYEHRFGGLRSGRITKHFSDDPLLANFHANSQDKDDRQVLATWFHKGEYVKKVTCLCIYDSFSSVYRIFAGVGRCKAQMLSRRSGNCDSQNRRL